ncbi:nucleotidyl transferase AbiEii/AbiGii toxin family protein [Betaproteobacteria bacterium SCN2]|jgi:predicted nucleotidyltransferase component of viral defense system|nr:nucleotidyl transferase AbiEii/AbiGii toxin family protein [Betaproteobacteria bacterium SCN2]
MPVDELYHRQVALLVQTIPLVAEERCFALKGGTAINLFIRDMPRLSVDIDLTYLPIAGRAESLNEVDAAMKRIAERIESGIPSARTALSKLDREDCVSKVIVRANGVQIKLEVTPVTRGCVYEPETKSVSPVVEGEFGYAEIQVVSFPDLYAGKIVAALDRQHPRDLFDVRDLLANEGIDEDLRRAFIVYLISHNRPMVEVLNPTRHDLTKEFERGFSGMTEQTVSLDDLVLARENLIASIVGGMPDTHRQFLLSFKSGAPDWELLGIPNLEKLPAVRWKMDNLARMDQKKRRELLEKLQKVLRDESNQLKNSKEINK